MKSKFKLLFCLIALVTMTAFSAVAQSYPQVSVSSDTGITLPDDSPLVEKYELDFSTFNWTEQNAQQAADYYDVQSDYFEIEVDFPNSKLVFTLDLNGTQTSSWNINQWQKHMSEIK